MILTCPECASRYVVDDARIGPQGRTVRCAACGQSWRATREAAEAPLDLTPAPAHPIDEPLPRPAATALPRKIRAERVARQRTRKAVAAGAVWGVLGALVLALLGGAALFRVEVVRLWPRTAGAYAKVGLPVNPVGLAPEDVQASPGLKDGHAAVIVTGRVRNVETRPHDPAPLKISLLDKGGKTLASQVAHLTPGQLQPGQTRPFSIAFLDPPSASADVQVEFALDAVKPKGEPAQDIAEAGSVSLRGLASPELPPTIPAKAAEPLPADSPYALPAAAHGQGRSEASGHDG